MSAMPITDLFGAGGGGGYVLMYRLLASSQDVVITEDGLLDILAVGGHGGGAAATSAGMSGNTFFASGASAGELSMSRRIPVKRGDIVTAHIGAGGSATPRSTAGTSPGGDGGDTVVVVGGRTITTKGGKGALTSSSMPLIGPRGGFGGTGGDLHIEGGAGGSVINSVGTTGTPYACAGSGAVGILMNDPSLREGGSVNTSTNNVNGAGGAGVGGRGGDLIGSALGSGGGSGGPAPSAVTGNPVGGPNILGLFSAESPLAVYPGLAGTWGLNVFGGGASNGIPAGPGGGGNGAHASNALPPGFMGGCGGALGTSSAATATKANGGPGGSAVVGGAQTATPSAGDSGLVILIVREG